MYSISDQKYIFLFLTYFKELNIILKSNSFSQNSIFGLNFNNNENGANFDLNSSPESQDLFLIKKSQEIYNDNNSPCIFDFLNKSNEQ